MLSAKPLTSEEALDDYFFALLDDDLIHIEQVSNKPALFEQPLEPITLQPSLEKINSVEFQLQPQYLDDIDNFDNSSLFELPKFEEVQRLLHQLDNSQLEAQKEIDALALPPIAKLDSLVKVEVEEEEEIEELMEEDLDLVAWDPSEQAIFTQPLDEIEDIEEVEEISDVQLENLAESVPFMSALDWQNIEHENEFQALFFNVMGVLFAVPLAQLGAIHQLTELNHLIGRPDWYLGLQNNKEINIDVLDTAKWVMPKSIKDDEYKQDYRYVVMLDKSKWGLACHHLAGTETLKSDQIRWRETAGKRPWLSGMVKDKMCALIHVKAMIAMLNAGLDVKGLE